MSSAERFLRACRREPTDCTPVWFMRQAGRYLPEYRAIRQKYSLLDICARPEVAAQVTLQPVDVLGVDAAILFADILLPLIPMGIDLEFAAGEGPVIHNPIRTSNDVTALRPIHARDDLASVMQTIRLVRRELNGRVPLIGFAGAPFTLASYLIEGGASRTFLKTKQLMYREPQTWHALMGKLAEMLADYLCAQIAAGAQAVQLFDSWVGWLSPDDYATYVLPYSQRIFRAIDGAPTIHFGTDTATLLTLMREAGGDVIGLDWRVPLDHGWQPLGDVAVQGNLDPLALFAPRDVLASKVSDIMRRAGGRAGHIFNLGHGILPDTPVDNVRAVVEMVHEYELRDA
ncbi:MAG: uroporphyrinogen decarboxylase [Chloroflexi bacterium]|nr:uroporphyrinogen decarboxylase [Chloroflexota bacterium]